MNNRIAVLAAMLLCVSLSATHAQYPPRGGMMGGAPHGPDFGGPLAKLFGDNSSFSATMDMQVKDSSAGQPIDSTGKIAVSDGKSRFEMDMIKAAGSRLPPQRAAAMKSMGMDTIVMISRPDLKVTEMIYPGLNAYVENAISDSAAAAASQPKIETTELGRETVDGHPCVKNKVVVTDDKGNQYESTVWNATDLKNFPVKIEQNQNSTETTMTFKDIKLDKVPADQFEVPSGATKYDSLPAMMQQEMMKRAMQNRGGQ